MSHAVETQDINASIFCTLMVCLFVYNIDF